jgi:bacterioferritin
MLGVGTDRRDDYNADVAIFIPGRGHCDFLSKFHEGDTMSDTERRAEIVKELAVAYWMEMETVMNFIACSINLDGVRAEEIKASLLADVTSELGHAQLLAKRIKTLGGVVPGSKSFTARQEALQPPKKLTDVVSVIKGVIVAEDSAIAQYGKLIKLCDGFDYVTQDLCITALGDEEEHRREFMGFLAEYEG